jgi:hypothetical protein
MNEVGKVKTIYSIAMVSYEKYQEARFESFIDGCKTVLKDEGFLNPDQEGKFLNWLEKDFAQKRLFDYARKAIDSSSAISRLALARTFTIYNSELTNSVPYIEYVLLRGFSNIDDLEIKLFLLLYILLYKSNVEQSLNIDKLHQLKEEGGESVNIWIPKEVFSLNQKSFSEFGNDPFSTTTLVVDSFIAKGLVKSANVIGNYSTGVGFQITEITVKAIDILAWATYMSEPSSCIGIEYLKDPSIFKS